MDDPLWDQNPYFGNYSHIVNMTLSETNCHVIKLFLASSKFTKAFTHCLKSFHAPQGVSRPKAGTVDLP